MVPSHIHTNISLHYRWLHAEEWMKNTKGATAADFNAYWNKLSKAAQKVCLQYVIILPLTRTIYRKPRGQQERITRSRRYVHHTTDRPHYLICLASFRMQRRKRRCVAQDQRYVITSITHSVYAMLFLLEITTLQARNQKAEGCDEK